MKPQDIQKVVLSLSDTQRSSQVMLEGEIPGATVFHHVLPAGERIDFAGTSDFLRILFLCQGAATFLLEGEGYPYDEKAVFVARPQQEVGVTVQQNAHLLEIRWELHDADRKELETTETSFPITSRYLDAIQYRDPFKSEKTISRAIIPQRLLPRFAMGSVETYGDDLIGQHEHPLLDQFFFSFPENNCDLLLDDIVYPMEGNTLLHIPLGCNHGVSVRGKQCAHYIWIDFIFDEEGLAYLDEVHKSTGTKRSF